jgi:hypothetical protein
MTRNISSPLPNFEQGLPSLPRPVSVREEHLEKVSKLISERIKARLPFVKDVVVRSIALYVVEAIRSCRSLEQLDAVPDFSLVAYETSPVVDGQVLAVVKISRTGLKFTFPQLLEDSFSGPMHILPLKGDCRGILNAA